MVFKQYTSLTVDSGQTLSTNVPCRGMFIYVTGNCVINGTISMTGKGAYANPASTSSPTWGSAGSDGNLLGSDGLRLGLVKSGSTESLTNHGSDFNGCGTAVRTGVANQDNISLNGKIYKVARTSSAAGAAVGTTPTVGNAGASGQSIFATGGGGSNHGDLHFVDVDNTGAAYPRMTLKTGGNISRDNYTSHKVMAAGHNVTLDTGISVNGSTAGKTLLVIHSGHTSSGTATTSQLILVRCGYDGNNTPVKYDIDGNHSSITVAKSASNTVTLDAGGSSSHYYITEIS